MFNPRRIIAVIATTEIQEYLKDFVASLRHVGWNDVVYVFCPNNNVPEIPDGCCLVPLYPWWEDSKYAKEMLSEVNNTPALLKPSIFLFSKWQDNDQILYVDCSDTVFFRNPGELFDFCQAVPVSARWFSVSARSVYLEPEVLEGMGLNMDLFGEDRVVNSGVIHATICDASRAGMRLWQQLCEKIPETGSWLINKKKVGDQKAFNIAFRHMKAQGQIGWIPKQWNDRDGIRKMYLDGTVLKYRRNHLPVYLPHASGNKNLPADIRQAATGALT